MPERTLLAEAASLAEVEERVRDLLARERAYLLARVAVPGRPAARITVVAPAAGAPAAPRHPLAAYLELALAPQDSAGMARWRSLVEARLAGVRDTVAAALTERFAETEASDELNRHQRTVVRGQLDEALRAGVALYLARLALDAPELAPDLRPDEIARRIHHATQAPRAAPLRRDLLGRHGLAPLFETLGDRLYHGLGRIEPSLAWFFVHGVSGGLWWHLHDGLANAYLACLVACERV